jgi:hypothetical protein
MSKDNGRAVTQAELCAKLDAIRAEFRLWFVVSITVSIFGNWALQRYGIVKTISAAARCVGLG